MSAFCVGNPRCECHDCSAARMHERKAVIAYLLDRAGGYSNSSGYVAMLEERIGDIAEGDHVEKYEAGEYDDLAKRVDFIIAHHAKEKKR